MNKEENTKIIVVTGDVTIDWNIARMRRLECAAQVWSADELTAAFSQRGGAAMLAELIEGTVELTCRWARLLLLDVLYGA